MHLSLHLVDMAQLYRLYRLPLDCGVPQAKLSKSDSVPMKTWKSSTPELDPGPSIGRESCSDSKRSVKHGNIKMNCEMEALFYLRL